MLKADIDRYRRYRILKVDKVFSIHFVYKEGLVLTQFQNQYKNI